MSGVRDGTGHGKLLLFGEHAAVYGRPACGITLPFEMHVRIADAAAEGWELPPSIGEMREVLSGFLDFAEKAFLGEPLRRGAVAVESDVPIGTGFGSSAAWCVAFVRAAFARDLSVDELWRAAHRAERFFHGTPSGIDTGLALFDGLYVFLPSPPGLPSARRIDGFPLHLVVGVAPRTSSTRELVGSLRGRLDAGDGAARRLVDELGDLSEKAIGLLDSGDGRTVQQLGELANRAHHGLSSLGLSTPAVDDAIEAARGLGAVGGKLSGAGGGGAFYLMFRDAFTADDALRQLTNRLRDEAGVSLFRFSSAG